MKDSVSDIYEAQGYLRRAAQLYHELKEIVPDGIYGQETEQAVKDFQELTGLPVTGSIDLETWNMLVEKDKEADRELGLPIQVAPITNADLPLDLGDTGGLVLTAQQMLLHISQQFSNIPEVPQNGVYDDKTAEAVAKWQHACRLPEDGKVDKATWDRLAQFYTMKQ